MHTTPLATTQLGDTGLEITRFGFGAWAVGGGGYEGGWGPQDDDESIAAIRHAIELGVNWIDTAPVYGWGHSETVVARAIAGMSPRPYLFTKSSIVKGPGGGVTGNQKRDSILREVHGSLERLDVDAIDLYQVHWPMVDEDVEEGWAAMAELKEEGLVRHIGVSNFDVGQMRRAGEIAPVETLQPKYSLIAREIEEEVLPFCESEGIGVIAYSPMGSGLLTGTLTRERLAALPQDDWRRTRFVGEELDAQLATADRVVAVARRLGVAAGAVAIAWALRNPAVDGAIVGLRRPEQADELVGAGSIELSDEDVAELEG